MSARVPRLLIGAMLLTLPLFTPRIRGADEIEYFSYLRSAVFDHDLEFGNEYERFYADDPQGLAGFHATFLERLEPDTGRHINFAPLGTALLWSPFYLLAHAVVLAARAAGAAVAADGFSRPYTIAACGASWLYGMTGLVLVHRLLVREAAVPEPAAAWATAAMLWATPVLYYVTLGLGFSHAVSLFVVAVLLTLTARVHREGFTTGRAALVGAVGGLAALVREQDGLVLVVPAVVILYDALAARRVGGALLPLAAMAASALAVFAPQLLAYHAINGHYGPSRLVARKMSYASPHGLAVLFDPAHGLFAWAPLLLLAVAGLGFALARSPSTRWGPPSAPRRDPMPLALAVAFVLQVWINGSVESWTQAGAFGSRRFVGITPVLAWGLAVLLAAGLVRLGRGVVAAALVLCAWWNVSLMVQFGLKLMDRQGLDWPGVAERQVSTVPARLGRVAWLFFTDRERLVREAR